MTPPRLHQLRRLFYRRRVDTAHEWRDAERTHSAEHSPAVQRILAQAATVQAEEHRAAVDRILAQAARTPDPVRRPRA